SRRPTDIPLLRRKVRAVLERSRVDPAGHDGKALLEILATLPRDELFALSEDALFDTALGVLNLQERRRVAMFLRRDPFERFVSVLIYLPPERYDLEVSERFRAILTAAFAAARIETVEVTRDRSALARVWIVLRTTPGLVPAVDNAALEHRLIEATRRWADHLEEAMIATCGEEAGLALFHRYGKAFPPAYRDTVEPLAAVDDIACLEKVRGQAAIAASFYLRGEPGLKLYRTDAPAALSDVVPILENFGFRVITEVPHAIETEPTLWIQDFGLSAPRASDLMAARARLEEAFARIWAGEMENDGLNRLILTSTLDGRQVTVFRLYTHYLRQAVLTPALREEALHAHPAIAAKLIAFFEARFKEGGEAESAVLERAILADLDAVPSFEEDHALRDFLHLIKATVRTNYFQRKPYLSVKIASQHLPMLAPPRPLAEIFVMSSTMEGVHARGGLVARGGIRWSERKQDFRSEILGLMKTQMVKNAVIVPVGAKGGFIVKGTSPADIVAGYQTLIRGLLDLTDNLVGSRVVPPAGIERRDEDDPYLVVAADKGTARFSDIANAMASEYGFWLGDAFASGGSHGFDHKAMGITARGAMETVKRHFRERGVDLAATLISVVGVGDMSGDVFGNFMIGSPHLKLVAAFDHRHIFLDPDPDQAASFAERRRLFALSQSSWADYDPRLISAGGGVFARSGKAIPISVEVRKRLGITAPVLDPPELIKAMLAAPVDLLWFGGIGTYVKGTNESHASIHDRSNDGLRIEGQEVRAQVIGEGANLAVTQLGRIEFARSGGAINTDAIDNSAGVDTSDHEVNIKILLDDAVAAGELSRVRRDALLREMVEEVAALVLKDNVDQGLALTLAGKGSDRAALARVMGALERSGKLDRALEFLPEAVDRDLTRPELAVLMAYVKTTLAVDLAASPLSMDPAMDADFRAYFPKMLATHFGPALARHRLRREIIATALANDLVNRAGLTLVSELQRQSGASPPVIAKAYAIARTVLDQETLWEGVSALDFAIPASLQMEMWLALRRAVARGSRRLVRRPLGAIALEIDTYRPKIAAIEAALPSLLPGMLEERRDALHARGVPLALGQRIAGLPFMAASFDIIDHAKGRDVVEVARRYFARLISVMNFRRMARATSSNPAAGMRKAPTPPMT
ncbi:MAG TPA: NAD-glutamate dehydrogenase domain-containing protein, partial [Stellaceae bacterium]|nr:NAD-glutamate dehydrogenase domain-containing protein [Stellaceae bacterium]